jgi:molybdopterin biosynthesis enzyme MoaB
MIRAVVERDGGVIGECVAVERDQMAIREALVEPGVDIILLIGGTGEEATITRLLRSPRRANSRSMA